MATAATGWKCTHTAEVVSQTATTATIKVTCYWQNDGWTYNINYVSAWVYCGGQSHQVKASGWVNNKTSNYSALALGSYTFTVNKTTAAQSISCYAKITSSSSYAPGTKQSTAAAVSVSAKTSYTVAYNANGGSGAPASQKKWHGTTLTLSSTKPTRTGYSFQGWATSSGGSVAYSAGGSYTVNAAATLYAVWKANTYSVKYDANGGTGAPSSQTKTYGKALTLSTVKPTRENYNFLGWATSASGSVAYAAGASYTANAAVTLYAVWGLAYVKPRITGLVISRANESSEISDDGTYAVVGFSWACDVAVSSITIEWKLASSTEYAATDIKTISASGTSGAVNEIIGNGALDAEKTYTFRITVADTNDNSTTIRNLSGAVFNIDFKPPTADDEKGGTAVGKPAELDGVFDSGYLIKASGGFINLVAEKVSDLNDLTTPNTYVSINRGASSYANIPDGLGGTFTIEVMSAGAEGQIMQRITACDKDNPKEYIRHYYQGAWGEWWITREDTGWINMTIASGITVGNEIGYLKARRKNGILYIEGDVLGVSANWTKIASLPSSLISGKVSRFAGVYNMSYFCGLVVTAAGALYVSNNGTGAWDATKLVTVNVAIGL